VVVTHDMLGLTERPPRFAPQLGDIAKPLLACFEDYVRRVREGAYPAAEHGYSMPAEQKRMLAEQSKKPALPSGATAK
jgi:3-methyl-2-oxobutanoate hydroxymethyltransferase